MKSIKTFVPLVLFISLFCISDLYSQWGYWGRGRGCRGMRMGYGRMMNFQGMDSTMNINVWRPGWGRGGGWGGGRGWGMGYGRWNNGRYVNPSTNNLSTVPPRFSNQGGGYWSQGGQYGRMYNPQTEEIIKGKIIRIDNITSYQRMFYGIHLLVTTGDETIPVHLGPAWYIGNQPIQFSVDDEIEILGSRILFDEKPTIIAAEVKKGTDLLVLRDEFGIPRWGGRGWRNW